MADDKPPLSGLVGLGAGQTEAAKINDFVFMSGDVSNAYLVNTSDGHVLVNTGTSMGGPRHKALFGPVAQGSLRYIVVTQSHPDHFGGIAALSEPGTQIVTDARFPEIQSAYKAIAPYANERTFKLWEPIMGPQMRQMPGYEPFAPDVLVHDRLHLEVGGRRFELYSTPGGETLDSLVVHLPDEAIVFTGNLFGPAWLNIPNLYTIRGDRIRSAQRYVQSLERVRALEPEVLITGHGQPVTGREAIQAALVRMRDAVLYIHDETIKGMVAGRPMRALMDEIVLPDHLKVGEMHGKVSWNVRAIWEEYIGWFDYGSTTELYGTPRSAVADDLVELAGAEAMAARAQVHVAAGRPLHALHLTDILLDADPRDPTALQVKSAALRRLLDDGSGENLSETMWLKSELLAAQRALDDADC